MEYGNACDDLVSYDTIHIYEPPTLDDFQNISACDSLTLCYSDLDVNFTGDIFQYTWTFNGGIPSSFSGPDPDFGCIKFSDDGSISLTIQAFDPCNDITEEVSRKYNHNWSS